MADQKEGLCGMKGAFERQGHGFPLAHVEPSQVSRIPNYEKCQEVEGLDMSHIVRWKMVVYRSLAISSLVTPTACVRLSRGVSFCRNCQRK